MAPKNKTGVPTRGMVGIRLSQEERALLEKEAEKLGVSLSEYIRRKLQDTSQLDRIEKNTEEIKEKIQENRKG